MCHLWPSISPFPSGHVGSVWDLPWHVWVGFARAADQHVAELSKKEATR